MTTLVLLRHGRSTANVDGVLAGRTPGIGLDDTGREQAAGVVARLADVAVDMIVSSPLERCRQTVEPLATALGLPVEVDERLMEVDYGAWTGRALKDLSAEPLWATVQQHPAGARFPDGEALSDAAARAVTAARDHVRRAAEGPSGAIVLCSHGDLIKAILADAFGLHLDLFQRIVVSPASVSVVRYTPTRPFVLRVNDTGSLSIPRVTPRDDAGAAASSEAESSEATVGGDTGR